MKNRMPRVVVLGLGKVGHLVAELLHETGFEVTGADREIGTGFPFATAAVDASNPEQLSSVLQKCDGVISCLPYWLNNEVARAAVSSSTHYFDLTEDVTTAREIITLSESSQAVVAPQCGLAPGFVAIAGSFLAAKFSKIRSIKLRVGALPKHPTGLLGYAFNWSPEGVVNEYLNDCEVIENSVRKWVSPMEWLEKIVIDGHQFEAFTTSGGIGTMCDTYEGLVENLDYKSIRYPGHAELMNFFFHELIMREDRDQAGKILVNAKPPVSEDVVYIHVSVEGWTANRLSREEFVRTCAPLTIAGKERRAIAWTTAASVCAVVEMVHHGVLPGKGLIRHENISLESFLATANGRLYDGKEHGGGRGS
jgi:saccharopine dehydrogenase-like NADP-dependent oxidoreductase